MKIFSAAQIRNWDAHTIDHEPVSSINLMERAAAACYHWLLNRFGHQKHFTIFCGAGNNGGDGLAIARMLYIAGVEINVFAAAEKGSPDFETNLQRLKEINIPIIFPGQGSIPILATNTIIIDAIFGTGLNRPAEGLHAVLIKHINQSGAGIISIDIPSGLFADSSSKGNEIIHADHTLSFQSYKLAFLMAENADHIGEIHLLDIGLDKNFPETEPSNYSLAESAAIKKIYRPRKAHSHKGNFGHAMITGGSNGKMGAVILAARACLRSGVGLLTVAIAPEDNHLMQIALPEAMTGSNAFTNDELQKFTTLGIGPGWGTSSQTQENLHFILQHYKKPIVLDADGLNCLSLNKDWFKLLPAGSILTPHPKEFERLFGASSNEFERLELAGKNAVLHNAIIILKGHYTAIACPDGTVHFNSTGNPGMAKGGSGDVLTGILAGLLAQGYPPTEAALMGVYLHGLAGDLASKDISQESMLAGDIIDHLGKAFTALISSASGT